MSSTDVARQKHFFDDWDQLERCPLTPIDPHVASQDKPRLRGQNAAILEWTEYLHIGARIMTQMEYPDIDAAIQDAEMSLLRDLAEGASLLAIIQGDDGRWYCNVGGPGNPVVITDSYQSMIYFLEQQGILDAIARSPA